MFYYAITSGEYSDYGVDGVVSHKQQQVIEKLYREFKKSIGGKRCRNSEFILWLTVNKGFTELDIQYVNSDTIA